MSEQKRETTSLELPFSKQKVEYYSYVKAREMLAIAKAEDGLAEMIKRLVLNIDGNTEDLYEKVLDLRFEDYKVLDAALLKLVKTEDEKKA